MWVRGTDRSNSVDPFQIALGIPLDRRVDVLPNGPRTEVLGSKPTELWAEAGAHPGTHAESHLAKSTPSLQSNYSKIYCAVV